MKKENPLTLIDNKTTDITAKELQQIQVYKDGGLPGLMTISDIGMTKALDLYMSGKTYHEIAKTIGIKKEIILYLAQKFNWYLTKMEQFEILDANMKERILHAKLVNQDFVLQIQQFYQAKIGRKMTRFLATGDDRIAGEIDGRDIDRYQKAVELLDKLTTEKMPNGKSPAVGLNLGESGVDITRISDSEISITPRNRTAGEMLSELANMKRKVEKEDSNSKEDTYDILLKEAKNSEEEKDENNE